MTCFQRFTSSVGTNGSDSHRHSCEGREYCWFSSFRGLFEKTVYNILPALCCNTFLQQVTTMIIKQTTADQFIFQYAWPWGLCVDICSWSWYTVNALQINSDPKKLEFICLLTAQKIWHQNQIDFSTSVCLYCVCMFVCARPVQKHCTLLLFIISALSPQFPTDRSNCYCLIKSIRLMETYTSLH